MSSIVLSANTSLNGSVRLTWELNSVEPTSIGEVAGFITVVNTKFITSKRPVDIQLSRDDIESKSYIVENLNNGELYTFTLSVYTTSFKNIIISNIVADTPSNVPESISIDSLVTQAPSSVVGNNYLTDVSLNVFVTINGNGGLPIDFVNLHLISNGVVPECKTYTFTSVNYDFSNGKTLALPIDDAVLNTSYFIYGEAVNESGASLPSNSITFDTTNKPVPMRVTNVVSGLDKSLSVDIDYIGTNIYPVKQFTLKALPVDGSGNALNGKDWSNCDFQTIQRDASGNLSTSSLFINGLINGQPYKVAAFATNYFQSGTQSTFDNSQVGYGVPAYLPSESDFYSPASGRDVLSLSGVLNTSTGSFGDGSITVTYNNINAADKAAAAKAAAAKAANSALKASRTQNTNDIADAASDAEAAAAASDAAVAAVRSAFNWLNLTFIPTYSVTIFDENGGVGNPILSVPNVQLPVTVPNYKTLYGVKYYATINVNTSVPANLQRFWANERKSFVVSGLSEGPFIMSTVPQTAPLLIDSSVYGYLSNGISYNNGNRFGLELFWSPPLDNGFSAITSYLVQVFKMNPPAAQAAGQAQSAAQLYYSGETLNETTTDFWIDGVSNSIDNGSTELIDPICKYFFKVSARNVNGLGPALTTNPITVTAKPADVNNVHAFQVPMANNDGTSEHTISLSWSEPSSLMNVNIIGYNIYIYNNAIPSLLESVSLPQLKHTFSRDTKSIKYGIQALATDSNNNDLKGSIYLGTFEFSDVPTITLPMFTSDLSGNQFMKFDINAGGDALIGLTLFIVPDAEKLQTIDNHSSVLNLLNAAQPLGVTLTKIHFEVLGVDKYTVRFESSNYPIPTQSQSYLLVASNSVGTVYRYSNLN